jgi:RNA polymerase sigma factor (sigma-70 family)
MTAEFAPYYHRAHSLSQMSVDTPQQLGDPALTPFLEAATDTAASLALEAVLGGDTDALIREVVRRELRGSMAGAGHLDDVASEVRVSLVRKLWALRRGRGEPIENMRAYVARAAEHGCYSFLRQRYPERARLRNRIRYATSHHSSLRIDRDATGTWRCMTSRSIRQVAIAGSTQRFIDEPRSWSLANRVDPTAPLPALLDALLVLLDQPIELDRLVDAVADILGVKDVTPATGADTGIDPQDQIVDPAPAIGDIMEQREALRSVWMEIVALPPRQRSALLLNLRDPDGGAVLHLLPATGVVTQAGVAEALGLHLDQLAALWSELPLDDRSIAEAMGLTRQQVINLRKSARARLARRLGSAHS